MDCILQYSLRILQLETGSFLHHESMSLSKAVTTMRTKWGSHSISRLQKRIGIPVDGQWYPDRPLYRLYRNVEETVSCSKTTGQPTYWCCSRDRTMDMCKNGIKTVLYRANVIHRDIQEMVTVEWPG